MAAVIETIANNIILTSFFLFFSLEIILKYQFSEVFPISGGEFACFFTIIKSKNYKVISVFATLHFSEGVGIVLHYPEIEQPIKLQKKHSTSSFFVTNENHYSERILHLCFFSIN